MAEVGTALEQQAGGVRTVYVRQLLGGKQVDMPPSRDHRTFKKAPKAKKGPNTKEQSLAFGDDDED
jgi:hypothetical protein